MADHALYEVKDSIGTITMNRPDRMNSLSGQMMDLLLQYLREASTDPDVRCVVLTGAGDRAFSAGADLRGRGEGGGSAEGPTLEQSIDGLQHRQEASVLLHTMPNAQPDRPYGVCTILVPAAATRLSLNGVEAAGRAWPRDREGRPFSTSALAFSESWTEAS